MGWSRQVGRGALLLSLVLLPACAGTRYAIRAGGARYPISFSPVLPDEQGNPAYLGEELEPCGEFKLESTQTGLVYSATGSDLDISEAINREVQAKGGVGVVSLAVTARNCVSNWLFPLTIFPFWPGCQSAIITGTVVRLKGPVGAGAPRAEVTR